MSDPLLSGWTQQSFSYRQAVFRQQLRWFVGIDEGDIR